jgi:hypothetical protein
MEANGDDSTNLVYGRRNEWAENEIAQGPVCYLYDGLNEFFAKIITDDFKATWEFFKNSVTKPSKERFLNPQGDMAGGSDKSEDELKKLLVYENLTMGAQKANWPQKMGSKSFIVNNLLNGFGTSNFMNFKQFTRALISMFGIDDPYMVCEQCLYKSKEKIEQLFKFIDCVDLGEFGSVQLYDSMQSVDTNGTTINSTTCNDFILKNGNISMGTVNRTDFIKGILLGYWQRLVSDNKVDDHYKTMMDLRKKHQTKK